MHTNILNKLENGILTEPMGKDAKGFEDFKLLIKSKVNAASNEDRISVALLALKYNMEDYYNSNGQTIEVGHFLKQFIESIEIKQTRFAKYIEIKPSNLSKILSGDRRMNMEMALILEQLSGIEASLWMNIQSKNELEKISKKMHNQLGQYKLKQLIE